MSSTEADAVEVGTAFGLLCCCCFPVLRARATLCPSDTGVWYMAASGESIFCHVKKRDGRVRMRGGLFSEAESDIG